MSNLTAEEFFDKNIKDLDGKETKNSLVFFYKDSIVKAMKEFAKSKFQEQRQICTDEAKECFNYDVKWALEVYEDKILNSPEPIL